LIPEFISKFVRQRWLQHVAQRKCDLDCRAKAWTILFTNQLHHCNSPKQPIAMRQLFLTSSCKSYMVKHIHSQHAILNLPPSYEKYGYPVSHLFSKSRRSSTSVYASFHVTLISNCCPYVIFPDDRMI